MERGVRKRPPKTVAFLFVLTLEAYYLPPASEIKKAKESLVQVRFSTEEAFEGTLVYVVYVLPEEYH